MYNSYQCYLAHGLIKNMTIYGHAETNPFQLFRIHGVATTVTTGEVPQHRYASSDGRFLLIQ